MENKENLLAKEHTIKQNRVWVRIASACNNKCIFCLDSEAQNNTFPSPEKVKKEISDGFIPGMENRVIISGGEASINPKFPEYISYAKSLGYDRVQTVTNGNMFGNLEFCKKVFSAGLEEVTFSFHSHNAEIHDYLVATPGAFKKSLRGLIYIKKYFPEVILNIDIVVNKINVDHLPDIIRFFKKLGVYEYDILQIIPFGRGFLEHKNKLFYDISEKVKVLHETWEFSKIEGMNIWTNRFPVEAFEGYEDLIQDPRKIKSEIMGEAYHMFEPFILSKGEKKPECYGPACDVCFQNDFCHSFMQNQNTQKIEKTLDYQVISGEEFPSQIYEKYGEKRKDFENFIENSNKKFINIPKCLGGEGIYETYNDLQKESTLEDYTYTYIKNLYRKKSLRCSGCKYNSECKGIHINFIRSYGFDILKPIQ